MMEYVIAQRYAQGLSGAIEDASQIDQTLSDLRELSTLIEGNHDLRSCLENPSLDAGTRGKVLDAVLDRMGTTPIVSKLMAELLRRGRVAVLADIVQVFEEVVDERMGRVAAAVTSATPLSADQEARLRTKLEEFTGKAVRLKCETAPEVLGGVVARVNGTVIDGSVRTRLEKLKHTLIAEEI